MLKNKNNKRTFFLWNSIRLDFMILNLKGKKMLTLKFTQLDCFPS